MAEKEELPGAQPFSLSCPSPIQRRACVVLGHGSGGRLTHELISKYFYPAFSNPILAAGNDAGIVEPVAGQRLAISTDSHVVWPLFFPGGDIGRLAVCGTVNDVAMMGATPSCLTAGFVLEEGLELALLERVLNSMREAAREAHIQIVAGDTKVVQHGKADGLYITTTGIGFLPAYREIGGHQAKPGDQIILSGPIGDHGIAVLSARGELGFEADVQSDAAPLNHLIDTMLRASENIHVLRDPTRGGVATTLNEISLQSRVCVVLDETRIPVRPAVKAACEMLGFDPLYVANEGRLLAMVPHQDTSAVLEAMHQVRYGEEATVIGEVTSAPIERVLLKTTMGSHRIVDMLSGEMLPRIC